MKQSIDPCIATDCFLKLSEKSETSQCIFIGYVYENCSTKSLQLIMNIFQLTIFNTIFKQFISLIFKTISSFYCIIFLNYLLEREYNIRIFEITQSYLYSIYLYHSTITCLQSLWQQESLGESSVLSMCFVR